MTLRSSPTGDSPHPRTDLDPYDAVLLVSFGGPEAPDEVMPFLRRVTAGRDIPDERLAAVAEHYHAFGGRSPINDQCRDLLAALRTELAHRQVEVDLWWGNRNSEPFLPETLAEMERAGHRRVLMVTTSVYPSYSSCRQYRENVAAALPAGMVVDRIPNLGPSAGFVAANTDRVAAAIGELGEGAVPRVLFVTHSVPTSMAETSGPDQRPDQGSYVAWHTAVADRVMAGLPEQWRGLAHELVFCSRSGRPGQPWLEPDVNDRLRELASVGRTDAVVLAPIGFVSDHMEVVNDLDAEALVTAGEVGLRCTRAGTAGTHPGYVDALVTAMQQRAQVARGERTATLPDGATATAGPGWERCAPECCRNARRPETATVGGATDPTV